jgi:hypothetical protein
MAVVISDFEAVGDAAQEKKPDAGGDAAPRKIEAAELRVPLRRIAARHARLSAH